MPSDQPPGMFQPPAVRLMASIWKRILRLGTRGGNGRPGRRSSGPEEVEEASSVMRAREALMLRSRADVNTREGKKTILERTFCVRINRKQCEKNGPLTAEWND